MDLIGIPMFITREIIIIALCVSVLIACGLLLYVSYLLLHKKKIESALIQKGSRKMLLDVIIAGYAIHIIRMPNSVLKKRFNIAIFLFANSIYDLIFSIGSYCTQLVKDEIKSLPHNYQIPLLFSAVKDQIQTGTLSSGYSAPHSFCLTGVVGSEHNYYVQISLLKSLVPSIKKILLLYGPTSVWRDEKKVTTLLENNYIDVHKIELGQHDDIHVKIVPYLSDVQLVMSLKDDMVMSTVERLISVCNEHKKSLFTSDLGSVRLGAALGFGTLQDNYGIESARYAQLILQKNINPSNIPVLFLKENDLLLINKKAAQQQGLEIDNQIVELIGYGQIFRS